MRLKIVLLLVLVSTSVVLGAQSQKRAADQTSDLLAASRFINTEEYNLMVEKGAYGELQEIVASAQNLGHMIPPALSGTSPTLHVTFVLSADGSRYQFRVTQTGCAAAFSDESGLIYLGTALGCSGFGGTVPAAR